MSIPGNHINPWEYWANIPHILMDDATTTATTKTTNTTTTQDADSSDRGIIPCLLLEFQESCNGSGETEFVQFLKQQDGNPGPAELCQQIRHVGDVLLAINNERITNKTFAQICDMLRRQVFDGENVVNSSSSLTMAKYKRVTRLLFRDCTSFQARKLAKEKEMATLEKQIQYHQQQIQIHQNFLDTKQEEKGKKQHELDLLKQQELQKRQDSLAELQAEIVITTTTEPSNQPHPSSLNMVVLETKKTLTNKTSVESSSMDGREKGGDDEMATTMDSSVLPPPLPLTIRTKTKKVPSGQPLPQVKKENFEDEEERLLSEAAPVPVTEAPTLTCQRPQQQILLSNHPTCTGDDDNSSLAAPDPAPTSADLVGAAATAAAADKRVLPPPSPKHPSNDSEALPYWLFSSAAIAPALVNRKRSAAAHAAGRHSGQENHHQQQANGTDLKEDMKDTQDSCPRRKKLMKRCSFDSTSSNTTSTLPLSRTGMILDAPLRSPRTNEPTARAGHNRYQQEKDGNNGDSDSGSPSNASYQSVFSRSGRSVDHRHGDGGDGLRPILSSYSSMSMSSLDPWRPPEPEEGNRRKILNRHMYWTGGPCPRWLPDREYRPPKPGEKKRRTILGRPMYWLSTNQEWIDDKYPPSLSKVTSSFPRDPNYSQNRERKLL